VFGGYGGGAIGYRHVTGTGYVDVFGGLNYTRLRSVEIGTPDDGWSLVTPMPETQRDVLSSTMDYAGAVAITLASGTWEEARTGALSFVTYSNGRVGASAIELDDGKIFFTGGDARMTQWELGAAIDWNYEFKGSSLIYDPETDTWTDIPHSNLPSPHGINLSFGWKPAISKLGDGRVLIFTNLVPGYPYETGNSQVWIYDHLLTGSAAWQWVADITGRIPNAQAHTMENGNVAVIAAQQDTIFIFDQCTNSVRPFPVFFNNLSYGGISSYVSSGTFYSVYNAKTFVVESFVRGNDKADRMYMYPNSSSFTASIPPIPPNPYVLSQLTAVSQLSASSVNSIHHNAAYLGDTNTGHKSDWFKFIPGATGQYYVWSRNVTDDLFPSSSIDGGATDTRLTTRSAR
jgi:hypothetical protein